MRWLLMLAAALAALGGEPRYTLKGRLNPGAAASVTIFGSTTPFSAFTHADTRGYFEFKKLLPGTYTIAIYVSGRGETRQTVEVGPSVADAKRRVAWTLNLQDSLFVYSEVERRNKVSASQLAIPPAAWREYENAQKHLGKRDVPAATASLERAVELAPAFSAAWNTLGTIAYQTRQYPRAEECFRRALEADAGAYEPLVNLGGVLISLLKLEEALRFNTYAVVARPNDALAQSQLGMTYFFLGKAELARKHLLLARRLDAAHFSHPQLLLAELELREKNWNGAAGHLEDFLQHHPDWPNRERVRTAIDALRKREAAP